MVPGLPSQLELRVDSKPSACSPHCGAPTAPVYGAAAQEKEKPCYVPPDHAGGSTTLGLRWSLVGGSMADATLGHMIFRHRSHTECTQQRGMHTRSASLLSCRLALSCRFAAPLEFARAQGRPVQPTMLVIPATTPVKTPISVGSFLTPHARARRDRHVARHRGEQRVFITVCKCDITTKTGGRSSHP